MWYSFGNKKRVSKKKVSSKQQFKITKTLNNFLERNRNLPRIASGSALGDRDTGDSHVVVNSV